MFIGVKICLGILCLPLKYISSLQSIKNTYYANKQQQKMGVQVVELSVIHSVDIYDDMHELQAATFLSNLNLLLYNWKIL